MSEAREEAERRWPQGWGNAIGDGTWRDGAINGFVLGSEWARAEWEAEQEKTEWEGIVLGREVGGSGDWSVTVWRPDEIEEARAMFPGSEYVLGRAKWLPVPDTSNNESEGKA